MRSKKHWFKPQEEKTKDLNRLVSRYREEFDHDPELSYFSEANKLKLLIASLRFGKPMWTRDKNHNWVFKTDQNLEEVLPNDLLSRAKISPGGFTTWRLEDVPEVIEAARVAGLANRGGEAFLQSPPHGIAPLCLPWQMTERKALESWQSFVDRSASETLASFNDLRRATNFERELQRSQSLQDTLVSIDHLRFELFFSGTPQVSQGGFFQKALRKMLPGRKP